MLTAPELFTRPPPVLPTLLGKSLSPTGVNSGFGLNDLEGQQCFENRRATLQTRQENMTSVGSD